MLGQTEQIDFNTNSLAVRHLCAADRILAQGIAQVGDCCLPLCSDRYVALVRSIVDQQLSLAAAAAIWQRMCVIVDPLAPEQMLAVREQDLRQAGLSRAKIGYIREISRHCRTGSLDLYGLDGLGDEEVIQVLCTHRGVGRWTAEMFLIFSLGRLDVLACRDAGLKAAVASFYGVEHSTADQTLGQLGEQWRPYRTVASLYLWQIGAKDIRPVDARI